MTEKIKLGAKLGSVLMSGVVLVLELAEQFNGRSESAADPATEFPS